MNLSSLFNSQDFMPHGHCFLWLPEMLSLHVVSDIAIGISYFSIPVAIFYFAHKRDDLPFRYIFGLFSLFILLCGATHFFSVWVLWNPDYGPEGILKALTAFASALTAMVVWKIMPFALQLPKPSQLREMNAKLTETNFDIEKEVAKRTLELQHANQALVETERARERLIAQLTRTNGELEQFAYIASHDLQEPLRMVASFTKLIDKRYRNLLDDNGREYVRVIIDAARRMQGMVSDLLEYARLDNEAEQASMIDCAVELEHVLENLKDSIADKKARVTADPLPRLYGHSTRFMRLLQNLVDNALKYRAAGVLPAVHIGAHDKGDHWQFTVRDNGIGIRPEYLEKIFVPFKRLHAREEYDGTGVGLAICRKIVEGFGGRIWVESVFGAGSAFHFTVPKLKERPHEHLAR